MTTSTSHDAQDPMDRLHAANPIPEGSEAAAPPIDPLLRRLGETTGTSPRGSTRRRAVRFGAAAVGAAAVVVAVVAVALTGAGGGRTDVVAEARAALAPRGEIIHTVVRSERTGTVMVDTNRKGRVGRLNGVTEQWSAADPLRTHSRIGVAMDDGTAGWLELDYADGVERNANTWDREMRVFRLSRAGQAERDAVQTTPAATQLGPDPIQGLHQLLDDGRLRAAGEVERRGRRVLRLVGRQPAKHFRGGVAGVGFDVEYLVDPHSYTPVQVTVVPIFPPELRPKPGTRRAHDQSMVNRMVFEQYERIVLTDDTAKLLRIAPTGRRIVRLNVGDDGRVSPSRRRP